MVYVKGTNCVNLIESGLVVIEIWGVKYDDLVVPLVFHKSLLVTATWLCLDFDLE